MRPASLVRAIKVVNANLDSWLRSAASNRESRLSPVDLVYLVGEEARGLLMHSRRGLGARRLNEA